MPVIAFDRGVRRCRAGPSITCQARSGDRCFLGEASHV
jgi:hypothetical protein